MPAAGQAAHSNSGPCRRLPNSNGAAGVRWSKRFDFIGSQRRPSHEIRAFKSAKSPFQRTAVTAVADFDGSLSDVTVTMTRPLRALLPVARR